MLPPLNAKTKTYDMTKDELIAWMRKYGWKYGEEEIMQKLVKVNMGKNITLETLVYRAKDFQCPRIKHKDNSWVFLTLFPTGVYRTCIYRNCRLTTGPIASNEASRKQRIKEITIEEAFEIEAEQQQEGLKKQLMRHADILGLFID